MSEAQNQDDLNQTAAMYFQEPSEEALGRLVEAATPYVKYFRRLYGGAASKDDLFQAGMEGVLKAAKEYDPSRGASFATFAGYKIMGEIRHWVRKEASYRRPGSISSLQFKIDAFIDSWFKENGVMPSPEQVADLLGIRVDGVIEVMRAGLVSFDEVDIEAIHSTSYKSFELPIEDKLLLSQLYQSLNSMQKKIWYLLFEKKWTQARTASSLGMTQKQVSREKERMMKQIREQIQPPQEKK
jgi:RNA polymerase sigma-B factor